MPSVELNVLVRRPGEDAFAFVAEPRNDNHWQAALVRYEGMTGAPSRDGSSWIEVRQVGPGERAVAVKVTEFDRPRSVGWAGDAGILRVERRFVFEGVADGSRVTQRTNFVDRGVTVLLCSVIASQSWRGMQHTLNG